MSAKTPLAVFLLRSAPFTTKGCQNTSGFENDNIVFSVKMEQIAVRSYML
jgi:hypothetical protein